MIELREVRARLGDFVLGPLTFSVEAGEHLWVVGPSGAGKTLLIETLAGFVTPENGEILLRGTVVNEVPPEERHCAWVPRPRTLFPHLSVAANIAYGMKCRGVEDSAVQGQVAELASQLQIEDLLARPTTALSEGQSQRVVLARALAVAKDVVLLDEPFAALDPALRRESWELVQQLHRKLSLTVVHVTHDLPADLPPDMRVARIVGGALSWLGTVAEFSSEASA